MQIKLPYGKTIIEAELPFRDVTMIEPRFVKALADEQGEFIQAVRQPVKTRPLGELASGKDKIAVVVPDITRPFPARRVLPWFFRELGHVPDENFTIIVGTGSHRPSTQKELEEMFGAEITRRYTVVDHNAHDTQTMLPAGKRDDGGTLYLNQKYVAADRRIIMGFIEPHFMAGFSGGYKAVMPGIADIDSIMDYHRAAVVGDQRSTWGMLNGNPTQNLVRKLGAVLPVDFCINLTLNHDRMITGFFCGETSSAHKQGCDFVRDSAMVPCRRKFPVVITTNGGYPLDQNLYQSVKGMSAAAQIVEQGGLIIAACECADGFPAHGNFAKLLFGHKSPQAILDTVLKPGFSMFDQWEAQLLAMILIKTKVALFSKLPPAEVQRAHLEHIGNLDEYLQALVRKYGANAPVGVLSEGPLTIPYLFKI